MNNEHTDIHPLVPGSSFFSNRACEYFPCHEGVDEDQFNCLLCYCPLYALGKNCGGNPTYTKKGVKSCNNCSLPHQGVKGLQHIKERFQDISDIASEQ